MHILLYVKLGAILDNVHICIAEKKCGVFFWFTCVYPWIVLGKLYPD